MFPSKNFLHRYLQVFATHSIRLLATDHSPTAEGVLTAKTFRQCQIGTLDRNSCHIMSIPFIWQRYAPLCLCRKAKGNIALTGNCSTRYSHSEIAPPASDSSFLHPVGSGSSCSGVLTFRRFHRIQSNY